MIGRRTGLFPFLGRGVGGCVGGAGAAGERCGGRAGRGVVGGEDGWWGWCGFGGCHCGIGLVRCGGRCVVYD